MFKQVVLIVSLIVVVNALEELNEKWQSFKLSYGRSYKNPIEEQTRYAIFHENLRIIDAHNKQFEQGLTSYKMAINKFTDFTKAEFAQYLGFHSSTKNVTGIVRFEAPLDADIPDAINWAELGAVTGIKDQGMCGSCWSFSATGAIEGQYYIKNKKLVSLSEQNLVDCSSSYGDYGCSGGIMDYAFQYVCDYGIMSEEDYPYVGFDELCHFDANKVIVIVKSFVDITVGSESDLQAAVAIVGPISVAVDATGFQLYESGILNDPVCGNDSFSLNHGILAVGYGRTEDGIDYWLVKNSWGENWGENGYIRMSRNNNNQCGIATYSSYPVL